MLYRVKKILLLTMLTDRLEGNEFSTLYLLILHYDWTLPFCIKCMFLCAVGGQEMVKPQFAAMPNFPNAICMIDCTDIVISWPQIKPKFDNMGFLHVTTMSPLH